MIWGSASYKSIHHMGCNSAPVLQNLEADILQAQQILSPMSTRKLNVTSRSSIRDKIDHLLDEQYQAYRTDHTLKKDSNGLFTCGSPATNQDIMDYIRMVYEEYGVTDMAARSATLGREPKGIERLATRARKGEQAGRGGSVGHFGGEGAEKLPGSVGVLKQERKFLRIDRPASQINTQQPVVHLNYNPAVYVPPNHMPHHINLVHRPLVTFNQRVMPPRHMTPPRTPSLRLNPEHPLSVSRVDQHETPIKPFLGQLHDQIDNSQKKQGIFTSRTTIRAGSRDLAETRSHTTNLIQKSRQSVPVSQFQPGSQNQGLANLQANLKSNMQAQHQFSVNSAQSAPIPQVYRYCLACEAPILQSNIQHHELACTQYRTLYSLGLPGILHHILAKTMSLKQRIEESTGQLRDTDRQELAQLGQSLGEGAERAGRTGVAGEQFNSECGRVAGIGGRWVQVLEDIDRLRWFVRVRELIMRHFKM